MKGTTLQAPREAVKHGCLLKHSDSGMLAVVDHGTVSSNQVFEVIHFNPHGGYWRPRSKHANVVSALMQLEELQA